MLAAAMASGFVFASSKVTVAVLAWNETATFATPGTAAIELFTMKGHEAHVMLSTAKVIVRSPANAAGAVISEAIRAKALKVFFIISGLLLVSRAKQQWGDVVEGEGRHDDHRRDPERELNDAAGNRTCAGGVVGTGALRLPVDEVEAVAEQACRPGDEERLIGCERRQIADPGAADAEAEQDQRHDAAGRGGDGAQNTAGGDQILSFRLAMLPGLQAIHTTDSSRT